MKVLIQDYYTNTAERELSERLRIACKNLGWTTQLAWEEDAGKSRPDFAIALHHVNPRSFDIPTFGCLWNPPEFIEQQNMLANVLSYDGYLFGSEKVKEWFEDILFSVYPKKFETGYILPTVHNFVLPVDSPKNHDKVIYCGMNWQKGRHSDLFDQLDRKSLITFIGPDGCWPDRKNVFTRDIPFDGESMIRVLSEFGAVLCLTGDNHTKWAIPTMRVFETIAAGSMPICDSNDFFKINFPESLFISSNISGTEQAKQVRSHLDWIKSNPISAQQRVTQLQRRLTQHFTLEKLLFPLAEKAKTLRKKKGFEPTGKSEKKIQVILRYGFNSNAELQRTLESITAQTFGKIQILAVNVSSDPASENILNTFTGKLGIERLPSLWNALAKVTSDYFGVIEAGDVWASNHSALVVDVFNKRPISGVVHTCRLDTNRTPDRNGILSYGRVQGLVHVGRSSANLAIHQIPPSSFLAKSSLLTEKELSDPCLKSHEVFYLLLLLAQKTEFTLLAEATVRSTSPEATTSANHEDNSLDRIRNRMTGTQIPLTTLYTSPSIETRVPPSVLDQDIYGIGLKLKVALKIFRRTGIPKFLRKLQSVLKKYGLYYKLTK